MPQLTSAAFTRRSTHIVGVATLGIGLTLVIAPERAGAVMALTPAAARIVGGLDLVIVPGLLVRRPSWWSMASRAGANLIIAGYSLASNEGSEQQTRARRVGAALLIATLADASLAARLHASQFETGRVKKPGKLW